MRLAPFATEVDVDEALRLFQVSTLDAAMSGSLSGQCRLGAKFSRFHVSADHESICQFWSELTWNNSNI